MLKFLFFTIDKSDDLLSHSPLHALHIDPFAHTTFLHMSLNPIFIFTKVLKFLHEHETFIVTDAYFPTGKLLSPVKESIPFVIVGSPKKTTTPIYNLIC
jgi:hypothetical protein